MNKYGNIIYSNRGKSIEENNKKALNRERYVICDVRSIKNLYGKKLKPDYIDCVFSGGKYDFVKKSNFKKSVFFKSKTYANKVRDKIYYDCDLGPAGINLSVIPVSAIGKDIDFEK